MIAEKLRKHKNIPIAVLFGLSAIVVVLADIHFTIPGTNIITDPREVFVIFGAALTGPIGAVIIGFLSSLYDPTPGLNYYIILQHIIGAVFIGVVYKKYIYTKLKMPVMILGWIAAILLYYYVLYIPLYFFVDLFYPDLFLTITSNHHDALGSLLVIYKGWIPEVMFTAVITSLILIALPSQYRQPLWGKTDPASVKNNAKINSPFLERLLSGNFLGLRLAIWYLLLSLIPFFIIKVFVQNNVKQTLLDRESARQLNQVTAVANLADQAKLLSYEEYVKITYNDYEFILTDLDSSYSDVAESLDSIKGDYIIPVCEKLNKESSGVIQDFDELISGAFAQIPNTKIVILSFIDSHKLSDKLDDLESKSTIDLGVGLVLIALFAGVVILLMVVFPIKRLIKASKKVGGGNYNFAIDQSGMVDELAVLGNTFNEMIANVKTAYNEQMIEMEERVKAEKERYEFEKELYYITENILDVIIQTDIEGTISYASPSIEKTFGYSKEYAIGKSFFSFIDKEEVDEFKESFDKIIRMYTPCNEQFKHRTADGTFITVEAIGNPILDDELKISSVIFTLRDVTDNIEYQESLKKAKITAEKSDKIKSEFLAQMSHEIRTPVNTILNFAYLLQEEIEDKLSDDLKDSFTIIERGSHRLIRTIDSILNLSQLQYGTMDVNKAYIDLAEIIEKVKVEFSHLAAAKGIEIRMNINCEDCNIYIDHYTVTQLVANLVDNAIKYSNKGFIEISVSKEGDEFVLEIQDTGIGMTENFIEKLFEPFSQEETGYTRRFEGTGLGLALVKKYCEINKADISVESEKGKGTKFTIRFEDRRSTDNS